MKKETAQAEPQRPCWADSKPIANGELSEKSDHPHLAAAIRNLDDRGTVKARVQPGTVTPKCEDKPRSNVKISWRPR